MDESIGIRIPTRLLEQIDLVITDNPLLFENRSHFFRAAAHRFLTQLGDKK